MPMGQKRKATSQQIPLCKEVELVPVKTKRLGTRLRARPVRQPQISSPKKAALPGGSPKKPSNQGSDNQPSSSQTPFENFEDDVLVFGGQFECNAGGSSALSMKRKKPGKVSHAAVIVETL